MTNIDILKNVSIAGRAAYIILCIEALLNKKYSQYDWRPLLELLCEGTSSENWEKWDYTLIELSHDGFFEFPDYGSSDFEEITEQQYDQLNPLYSLDIPPLWDLIECLRTCVEVYLYSSIPGDGPESLKAVLDAIGILEKEGVPVPSAENVEFSSFSEYDGWGKPFDGIKLSSMLDVPGE